MATTLPVTGVGNSTDTTFDGQLWDSAPNGALTLIGASDQDNNFGFVNDNRTQFFVQGWLLNSLPSDFKTMNSLSIQLRFGWSATPTNTTWPLLAAKIVNSGVTETILAAATSGGDYQSIQTNITTTTATNSSVISFSFLDTAAEKSLWDNNAFVLIGIDRVRNKGGGTEEQRVYALSLTGEYTALDTTTKYFFIT
jgi:hypothetical protein